MIALDGMTQLMYSIVAILIALVTIVTIDPWYKLWQSLTQFWIHVGSFIILFLIPIHDFIHLVLVLLAFDVVTGIWASLKRGESFSAKKLGVTVTKFILYGSAIIIGYVLQLLVNDGTQLARIVAIFIGATEAKSSYENISKITGIDLITNLWDLLSSKVSDYLKNTKTKRG